MVINALLVFSVLSHAPIIGKWARRRYYQMLLLQLEDVEFQFTRPTTRFVTNIHRLYQMVSKAHNIPFNEDFRWMRGLTIATFTLTSGDANKTLEKVLIGSSKKFEEGFRNYGVVLSGTLLDWYSGKTSVERFLEISSIIIGMYCSNNPLDEELGDVYTPLLKIQTNAALTEFISGRYFRLMVSDYITVLKVTIQSQLRVLDGTIKEGTQS